MLMVSYDIFPACWSSGFLFSVNFEDENFKRIIYHYLLKFWIFIYCSISLKKYVLFFSYTLAHNNNLRVSVSITILGVNWFKKLNISREFTVCWGKRMLCIGKCSRIYYINYWGELKLGHYALNVFNWK